MYDTIIIGAGMSGLAAGIRLAHFGRRVAILERHTTIGGLNSFYRLDGRQYDSGLHAVTNYTPPGSRQGPLVRILRQLRLRWEDFDLVPQSRSAIRFPGAALEFENGRELFEAGIARQFPRQFNGFRRLTAALLDYDQFGSPAAAASARAVFSEYLGPGLLAEMLLTPILFYGGAREHDLDWGQCSILFRAIYLEGLARPRRGVRQILKALVRKYKAEGGELRLHTGVRRITTHGGRATAVVLDSGEELPARQILSSAGWHETARLCAPETLVPSEPPGRLSFAESISVLDVVPRKLGFTETIVFFNDGETFDYARPDDLADVRSGVICSPNNFAYDEPLEEGAVRVTVLANHDGWETLSTEAYRAEKHRWYDRMTAAAVRHVPDFRGHVVATDMFTPTTIRRYTGHDQGAVYGAPVKRPDGMTPVENLFLCGTDQGLLGIVGAILSGITMANRHCLNEPTEH